jgi:hypothetical protein
MKRYKKIPAELVVASREVLEVRPVSQPPEPHPESNDGRGEEDDRWDNSPCTD